MLKIKIKQSRRKLELEISAVLMYGLLVNGSFFAKIKKIKFQKILPSRVTLDITFYKYAIFFD